MQKIQSKVRRYFDKFCTLKHTTIHDLTQDERRLQDEVNSKNLRLRWNQIAGFCQVWCDDPRTGLYCVLNLDGHYNLAWAIWELKRRQMKRRQLLEMWEKAEAANNKIFSDKNEDLSRELAELYSDHKVGKVSTSAITKEV